MVASCESSGVRVLGQKYGVVTCWGLSILLLRDEYLRQVAQQLGSAHSNYRSLY